jgi:hypothetical protein
METPSCSTDFEEEVIAMKTIARVTLHKIGTAALLCVSLVVFPAPRVANVAAVRTSLEKSESQYRAEARRYDTAIRAIAGITSMNLETPDDLKKALAIVGRARPDLNLFRSKWVVVSLDDSTFRGAIKERSPNKQAAEKLVQEINADRSAVLKLKGAEALKTNIERSLTADATTLRLAGEWLKKAGEKIKKTSQAKLFEDPTSYQFQLVSAGLTLPTQPPEPCSPLFHAQDPLTIGVAILAAMSIAVVVSEVILFGVVLVLRDDKDDSLEECLDKADAAYNSCEAAARNQPFPLNLAQLAICDGLLLAKQAACFVP